MAPRGTVVKRPWASLGLGLLITASLRLHVLTSKIEIIMFAIQVGLGLGEHRGAEKNRQAIVQLCWNSCEALW